MANIDKLPVYIRRSIEIDDAPKVIGCIDKRAMDILRLAGGSAGLGHIALLAFEINNPGSSNKNLSVPEAGQVFTKILDAEGIRIRNHKGCAKILNAVKISQNLATLNEEMFKTAKIIKPDITEEIYLRAVEGEQTLLGQSSEQPSRIIEGQNVYKMMERYNPAIHAPAVETIELAETSLPARSLIVIQNRELIYDPQVTPNLNNDPHVNFLATPDATVAAIQDIISPYVPIEHFADAQAIILAGTYEALKAKHNGQLDLMPITLAA
jgi:hypothetical protein